MIVTASAAHAQPEEGLRKNIYLVMNPVGLFTSNIDRGMSRLSKVPETCPLDGLVCFELRVDTWLRDEVPGQVLFDPLVIGHISVEAPDDIVPVTPGLGDGVIRFVSFCLSETNQVQPVLTPVFSEMRRLQKLVDKDGKSAWRFIRNEFFDLLDAGGQAGQGVIGPLDEGSPGSIRIWIQAGFLDTGQNKPIQA